MKTIIFICASLISLNLAWSHEGHDKTPGAIAAVHGGMVEGKGHIYLELVSNSDEVKIYPFDHDQKPIPLSEIKKINGKMSFPRKNKAINVKFSPEADHFSAKVDSKGANRYELAVKVNHGGKDEKIKFNVEQQ